MSNLFKKIAKNNKNKRMEAIQRAAQETFDAVQKIRTRLTVLTIQLLKTREIMADIKCDDCKKVVQNHIDVIEAEIMTYRQLLGEDKEFEAEQKIEEKVEENAEEAGK